MQNITDFMKFQNDISSIPLLQDLIKFLLHFVLKTGHFIHQIGPGGSAGPLLSIICICYTNFVADSVLSLRSIIKRL